MVNHTHTARYAPGLEAHLRPIGELTLDPHNARAHSDRNIEAIAESLERFGQQKPIVVAADGTVLAGNGTLAGARHLGWTQIAALDTDLEGAEARGYAIADNRTAELAEWDMVRLSEELEALPPNVFQTLGFDEKEMRRISAEADAAIRAMQEERDDDDVPETPDDPVTKPGDLWLLGSHRILCGDSTNDADVARLMNGDRASLLATDPPYLVDYQGGNHPQSWANKPEVKDKHWDDYTDPTSGAAFFESFLKLGLSHCREGIAVYQWFATKRHDLVEQAWRAAGLLPHQELIWAKARAVLTRSDFMWQHEPCMYGWVKGNRPTLKPPPNETTVWHINQQGEQDGIHPTQKPVELFSRPIRWHTLPGEICYEPFSGSGTQIIAAERLERRCFAMELSPAFVDVAVARWEALTGNTAERVSAAAGA